MNRVGQALELVSELTAASTVSKAVDVFQRAIEPFGVRLYKNLVLSNVVRTGGEQILATNWPDEWDAFYQGTRAFAFDPVAAAAMHNDGFFWRDLPPAPSFEGRKLMLDAKQVGMVDGFTAICRMAGEQPLVSSMAGQCLDWNDLDRGVVTLVSNTLMSRMLYLRDIQLTPIVAELSPRELAIISFAAAGKHDKQIALELDLSHETIRFYWKSIRRKLGATDRANAVAIALWSRLSIG